MEKRILDWEYIQEAVDNLVYQIHKSDLVIKNIKGLQRGGLIPAVMLSHRLGVPMLGPFDDMDSTTLVVDDICDTGTTLAYYEKYKFPTAVIHFKHSSSSTPTFYYDIAEEDIWLVYPWETEESPTIQDYLIN
jgi:hypoxanthine phosphoribosyltransferase